MIIFCAAENIGFRKDIQLVKIVIFQWNPDIFKFLREIWTVSF